MITRSKSSNILPRNSHCNWTQKQLALRKIRAFKLPLSLGQMYLDKHQKLQQPLLYLPIDDLRMALSEILSTGCVRIPQLDLKDQHLYDYLDKALRCLGLQVTTMIFKMLYRRRKNAFQCKAIESKFPLWKITQISHKWEMKAVVWIKGIVEMDKSGTPHLKTSPSIPLIS